MRSYLALLLILPISIFAGGPWLNTKKSGFFQLQTTFPVGPYNSLFLDNGGPLSLNRNMLDITFQAYLEYGITNKLTLTTTLPYKYVAAGDQLSELTNPLLLPKGNLSGLSNYQIGLKYGIIDKKLKLALSLQSSINTIQKDITKGLITGYDANSFGLYMHTGKSFSGNLYSFVEGGVNISSNNFSDFFTIHYELGYKALPSFWVTLTIDIRESLKNGSFSNENLRQTGLYTNEQAYFAYGIKTAYEFNDKLGLTFATFGAFSGNYVAQIGTFSLGVYKKW